MKLNSKSLRALIVESLTEVDKQQTAVGTTDNAPEQQEKDPTKIKQGSMSQGAHKKTSLDDIADKGEEFTNQERNIVAQIQQYISDVAAAEGVDLMRMRPLLQRALKLINTSAANIQKQTIKPTQGDN